MGKSFTPEQEKVIELRDRNILVSAAAGSGKTTVLVERIIRMITEGAHPVDIDRLLVVTFTNAAAAEMRERIAQAIDDRLARNPENEHLQRQASLLHNAQITTIDSFCLFVIRNNFNDIGLDPGFRVADEGELKLLRQDVMRELLEEKYQEGDLAFLDCVEYFTGSGSDQLLEEYISRLYDFSMSCPWPEDWISQCMRDYQIESVEEMEKSAWCDYLLTHIKRIVRECETSLGLALEIVHRPDGPYMYGEILEQEREMLNHLSTIDGIQRLYEAFGGLHFARLPAKKDDSVNPVCREKVKEQRSEVKKRLQALQSDFFSFSPEQVLGQMRKAAPNVEQLLRLVLAYKERLDEKKRKDNIIDFGDMEHFALNILVEKGEDGTEKPTPAAVEYRQFFREILIDEYQDSNQVQELLLGSISGEAAGHYNRFMVGDVKQSIYKFRLARPELFMEKYETYTREDSSCQRIDLHRNFRSRRQVLDSVNELFRRIMGRELGGVEYDDEAALYPGASFPEAASGGKAASLRDAECAENTENIRDSEDTGKIDRPETAENTESGGNAGAVSSTYGTEYMVIGKDKDSSASAREQEAAVIARRIRELYSSLKVTDLVSGMLRPVRYSDMVILLRTTAGWAEDFKRVLEEEGIPAYVPSSTGYFQAAEIRALLQLLRVIDNPLQDIPLYGTLKSFFGGFTEDEIGEIRGQNKRDLLYHALIKYKGRMEEKIHMFLNFISRERGKTSYTPIHRLIQEIMADTGYLDYVFALPGGRQRRANVEMLLTRAAAFENTSYYGLFHFLRYIEQLEKYEVDYGLADILDENADVVRIMSIHKSKGLEFPVCFVAGLAKKFNLQDVSGRLIADVDMGIGADYIDSAIRVQSTTLKKSAVALKMKLDALGEEMRVLYVAMTRAREKLILTAMTDDLEKFQEKLELEQEFRGQNSSEEGKISFSSLAAARSCLELIFPCLENPLLISPEEQLRADVESAVHRIQRKHRLFQEAVDADELTKTDNEMVTELSKRFGMSYKYQYLSDLYVKTTVSELKKKAMNNLSVRSIDALEGAAGSQSREGAFSRILFEEPEVVPYIPSFIESREDMSGTDRGSAYHKAMELFDFPAVLGRKNGKDREAEIFRQLENFKDRGLLEERWRKSISGAKLFTFFESSLARRMCRADRERKLFREQPFVLGISADRLGEQYPDSEQVLIQGIIDVFFEEEGRIVVADYKTDAVKTPKELIERYQVQLDYYGEALTRLTGKEVSQKIIYSFALGKEIMLY